MLVAEPIQEERRKRCGFGARKRHTDLLSLHQAELQSLRSDQLRLAIRNNLVTFPSQVPVFERHDRPDFQRRIVQLYFLFGWSCETIAARFGLLRQRVGQVLNTWKKRAVETGYIQIIPPVQGFRGPKRPIRIVLFPVVCDRISVTVEAPSPSPAPAWGYTAELLMNSIKESYGAEA